MASIEVTYDVKTFMLLGYDYSSAPQQLMNKDIQLTS